MNRLMAVLGLALGCSPTAPADKAAPEANDVPSDLSPAIPMVNTPADALSTETYDHSELLRIERDFGKPEFEIALDAWIAKATPNEIAEVRLWWAKTHAKDARGPFGDKTKRHFELEYERASARLVHVRMISDDRSFTFSVELDDTAGLRAFAEVLRADGNRVPRCRPSSAKLVAKRLLGAPVGIQELEVTCTDDDGAEHTGLVQ